MKWGVYNEKYIYEQVRAATISELSISECSTRYYHKFVCVSHPVILRPLALTSGLGIFTCVDRTGHCHCRIQHIKAKFSNSDCLCFSVISLSMCYCYVPSKTQSLWNDVWMQKKPFVHALCPTHQTLLTCRGGGAKQKIKSSFIPRGSTISSKKYKT